MNVRLVDRERRRRRALYTCTNAPESLTGLNNLDPVNLCAMLISSSNSLIWLAIDSGSDSGFARLNIADDLD